MIVSNQRWLNLPSLGLPVRVLFTGFLLATGFGLMMAGTQILLTHGMADGEWGLSMDDIVYSYYGDRTSSKLEAKLNGSMRDKAPAEVKRRMILWSREGADEAQWNAEVKGLFQQHCVSCHSVIPGLPDFRDFQAVKAAAEIDEGETVDSLTRVSHIHIFGISFIFFFVGLIFSFSVGIPRVLKALLIFTPFAFLVLDVLSWWLTKMLPGFALVTIIGGVGYTLASSVMILTSLYQMWWLPRTGRIYRSNEWRDD